jgi:hypothetical protein
MLRVMAESINVGFADVLNRAADVQHAHVHLAPQRKSNRAQLPEGVQWIADDLVALWLGPAASAQAQAVAALAAFAARAFARFAASFAFASGDILRFAAPAPDLARNAAHLFFCAAAIRLRAARLSTRFAWKEVGMSEVGMSPPPPLPAAAPPSRLRIPVIFASICASCDW